MDKMRVPLTLEGIYEVRQCLETNILERLREASLLNALLDRKILEQRMQVLFSIYMS